MARPKVFDLSTVKGRSLLDAAYLQYMKPNWNILSVAALFGVSPTTLGNAFKEAGFDLKIKTGVSRRAVLNEQATLLCPLDYLAAKYGVTEAAIYKWAKEEKRPLQNTRRFLAQRWWDAFFARFEDPNDAVIALTQKPHGIPLHRIPALYHRRAKPQVPVLWQLDSPTPYNELDLNVFNDYTNMTEPSDHFAPRLWLGFDTACNPVQWIATEATDTDTEDLDDDYSDDESDLDLAELAAELGVEL